MNIAVNTRLLLKDKLEGIGWFSCEVLKRLVRNQPEHKFYFLFDRDYHDSFLFNDNITPLVIGPQARHPLLFYQWFQHSVPKALNKVNADLFLSPDGYLSLNTEINQVPVIHDLNFEHYPKDLPWLVRKYYRYYFPKFAKKASRIATVSTYSKNDIVKQYGIQADKIDVVYNGCNMEYRPLDEVDREKIRNTYTGGQEYFLFVGALHPRKNLVNLFKAFDRAKLTGDNPVKLLIVGEKKWWTSGIKEAYNNMQFRNDVVFTGRLEPKDLCRVTASALALTYVSYFEGFGIPILEAMNCDVPVITSNVTSMPEVAGDAALLVNPFSVDSIANAMLELTNNEAKRGQLIEKGRIQRDKFSWDKTADLLWNTVEKAVGS